MMFHLKLAQALKQNNHKNWFEWVYCRAVTVRSEIYISLSFDGGCGE